MKIFLIEITISWIDNWEIRFKEKCEKYTDIIQNIKYEEPNYKVDQITLVIDSLGGHSQHLEDNIAKLFPNKLKITSIIKNMQKTVLEQSVQIARRFKLSTL